MSEASFPFPDVDWEPLRGFFQAAARGELAIPRCTDCGHWNWYPPERCRACDAGRLDWTAVSGRGSLFTFSVVRRGWVKPFDEIAPYATGLVALDEDPSVRIVTLIVDCSPDELRIDLPMRAVFRPLPLPGAAEALRVPLFTPAEPSAGS